MSVSFIGADRGLRGLRRTGRLPRTVCSSTAGRPGGNCHGSDAPQGHVAPAATGACTWTYKSSQATRASSAA
eukprot:8949664-Heterocapsa_arctica.AAC.1